MENKFLLDGGLSGRAVSLQVSEAAAGISVRWLRKTLSVGFGNPATNSHFRPEQLRL